MVTPSSISSQKLYSACRMKLSKYTHIHTDTSTMFGTKSWCTFSNFLRSSSLMQTFHYYSSLLFLLRFTPPPPIQPPNVETVLSKFNLHHNVVNYAALLFIEFHCSKYLTMSRQGKAMQGIRVNTCTNITFDLCTYNNARLAFVFHFV